MIPDTILRLFGNGKPKDPVAEKQRSDLQQAELELLQAQAEVEDWNGRVRSLKTRVARLRGTQVDIEQPQPVVVEETQG